MGASSEKAARLFKDGYNCSQAVFGAFCDKVNIPFETAMMLTSSFGGGMGRLREVCGAVSAMFIIAGLKDGYSAPETGAVKAEHYKLIQDLAEKFKQKNGTIICRELLNLPSGADLAVPAERSAEYYTKRPCIELVKDAAGIIENYLGTQE